MNATSLDLEGPRASIIERLSLYVPAALRRVFAPFLISRLVVVLILAAAPLVAQIPINQWGKSDSTIIKLNGHNVIEGLRRVAIGNDSGWYFTVARDGYEQRPFDTSRQANWAFFPLHPLLWRAAAFVTGEWFWSGILISNLFCLLGLALLWQLARNLTGSERIADSATLFASFWPSAYFMLLPHTEALFLALTCLSLLASSQHQWKLTGAAGFLASATRFNGLFLLPAVAVQWLESERRPLDLLKFAPIVGGTAVYMWYLWAITGNPFAFKDIQVTWGRELTVPWSALLDYLARPHKIAAPWNPRLLHFGITIIGICSVITCWRRGWRGLAIFTALTILAPLCTGTLTSMTRYLSVSPGIYLALAIWSERSPRFGQLCMAMISISLALMCTLFALGINIAGA